MAQAKKMQTGWQASQQTLESEVKTMQEKLALAEKALAVQQVHMVRPPSNVVPASFLPSPLR